MCRTYSPTIWAMGVRVGSGLADRSSPLGMLLRWPRREDAVELPRDAREVGRECRMQRNAPNLAGLGLVFPAAAATDHDEAVCPDVPEDVSPLQVTHFAAPQTEIRHERVHRS